MQINITYDSSVASAPAGFKTAVAAAVKYFEQTISTPITVNLTFGWGEVGGQPMDPGALGESSTTLVGPVAMTPYGLVNKLLNETNSPAIIDAAHYLNQTAPAGTDAPSVAFLPFAEARALGVAGDNNAYQDGYIGLNSTVAYAFNPSNRAVAGKYDAIGVLEHEISEVLGRQLLDGAPPPGGGSPQYEPLDFFRFSAPGVHSLTPGGGYLSLNGDQLLLPFNDPSNGGDAGDWSTALSGDSFDAFAQTGTVLSVSPVDVRELELLGYTLSYTAPSPNGIPVKPQTVSHNLQIASGQTLSFDGARAILLTGDGAVTNSGSIIDTGVRSVTDVVGIMGGSSSNTGFTNSATGVLSVTATVQAADAVAVDGYAKVNNSGAIQVTSDQADAWGIIGNSFTNNSGSSLTVQAADHATGVNLDWFDGGSFSNAGTVEVTGLHAIGVDGMTSFDNSGTLEATGMGTDATSVAVFITASAPQQVTTYTNSGTISGHYAIEVDPHFGYSNKFADSHIINSGTINGIIALSQSNSEIDNTGSIAGAIYFGDGNSVYNGAGGTQSGGIYLGHGTNTVTLGDDGEAVAGGGGTDTITGGAGNDFVEIALGNNTIDGGAGFNTLSFADAALAVTVNLATGTANAGGTDTLSNIQEVIGSNYGNTFTAGNSAVTFVAGTGHDVLRGGAGDDTLIAGAGGDTASGGGGNNTFIYSSGDQRLTITDFGANGDQDVVDIYGYASAKAITQKGVDTIVTLSRNDSILLKNTNAGSVSAHLVFSANPYQAPAVPMSLPVFGTTPIHFTYDLTIFAGETINEANQNVGLSDDFNRNDDLNVLDNFGNISVSSSSGDVSGVVSDMVGNALGSNIINEAGANYSVSDTDSAGTARGVNFDLDAFSNAGAFTVSAQGDAIGIDMYGSATITNAATGTFSVVSATGDATGIYARNGESDTGHGGIDNEGNLHVTGDLSAYGIRSSSLNVGPLPTVVANNGNIVVDGENSGTHTYGIYGALWSGSNIENAGTITAQTAIDGVSSREEAQTPISLTNSGTINGAIILNVIDNHFQNTGSIVGDITFTDSDTVYDGSGGTLQGVMTLGYGQNTITLGNDGETVIGGGYCDHIAGGTGNDFFEIGRGTNVIHGGGGMNTLSFADADMGVRVDLGKGTANASGIDRFDNIQTVIGSAFNDTLIAANSGSTLIAGTGTDVLTGRIGNDTLVAGAGGDTATGGGGNNTFIYSTGDHRLVVNDFDKNGDQDVLQIDGYSSAVSIKQVGANTLITLSATDSVLLKNVSAGSLGGAVVYNPNPYQPPAAPNSPPEFFSNKAPINIDYALDTGFTVYKGESVQIVSHTGDLNLNQNIALWDDRFSPGSLTVPVLDNSGTLAITSSDDNLFGLLNTGSFGTQIITNEAHATLSIADTGGSVSGIVAGQFEFDDTEYVTNNGTIDINALTSATGTTFGLITNGANGVLNVTSSTADATGIDFCANVENDGAITVNAATTAIAISSLADIYGDGFYESTIVNNGTITATSSDPNGESYGIDVSYSYNVSRISYITNTGTITAKIAIMNADSGDGYTPISMSNSGTINGEVNMGGSDSQMVNSGAINGDVIFLTVTNEIADANLFGIYPPALTNSGTITGDIFLNGSDATITNTGTITSNDIELGTGGTLISTQGIVQIGHPSTVATGTVRVGSGGTLEGAGSVQANLVVAGTGLAQATGGTLSITGNVSGNGQMLIGASSTLDVSGTVTAGIEFTDGTGTLRLHTLANDTGQIGGLHTGDTIDLAGITATTASISAGILTVTDTVNDTFTFHVAGDLTGNGFAIMDDGAGGTDLVFGPQSTSSQISEAIASHDVNIAQLIADEYFFRAFFLHHGDSLA